MPASRDMDWRDVEIAEVTTDKRGGWWVTLLEKGSRGAFDELSCRCDKASYERIRAFAADRGFRFDLTDPDVLGKGARVDLDRDGSRWKLVRVKEALTAEGPYSKWCADEKEAYRRSQRLMAVREPRPLTVEALREDDLDHAMRGKRCLVIAPEGAKGLSDIESVLARHGVAPDRLVVSFTKLQASPDAVAAGIRSALQSATDDVGIAVVARGGGACADMAAFDSSAVARAIASSPVPVICAVGHEEDVHLADQAATYSAGSPSAAAYCLAPILDEPGGVNEGTPASRGTWPGSSAGYDDVTREMPTPSIPPRDPGPADFWASDGGREPASGSAFSAFDSPAASSVDLDGGVGPTHGYGAMPRPPRNWPRRVVKLAVFAVAACLIFVGVLRPVGRWFSSLGQGSSSSSQDDGPRMIRSKSRNIVCELSQGSVRCDINTVKHNVPAVPKRCVGTPNWGHVYVVTKKGVETSCPQERRVAASTKTDELPYGESITVGDATCSDARTGMTCKVGSHGVTLSQARTSTW